MRLFTGIELDASVIESAAGVIDELTRRVQRLAPRGRVGWVTPERLHITVRFIGHCDDGVGALIRGALEPPLLVRPFALAIRQLGAFPPKGTPRVIWAGLHGDLQSGAPEAGMSVVKKSLSQSSVQSHPMSPARPWCSIAGSPRAPGAAGLRS